MPYQIDRTDGTVVVTLADGVVDTSTDLKLVGRNVAGYGEQQNENFIRLLENFARADTPPSKPQIGQLWFDKNADKLRPSVFDGTQWRNLSITQVQSTEPNNQKEGDLWWDTVNNKLYVWQADGDQHILVGPESILGFNKTRWSSEKLTDTGGTDHPCSIGYIDGVPYMVMADTAFEIDQAVTPLAGFTRIGEGITAKGTNVNGVTSSTTRFFGTAGDADRLGGRLANTWANLNDNEIVTGNYSFQNDSGINIGAGDDLTIDIDSGTVPQIFANTGDELRLGVDTGSGAETVIYIKDKNVLPNATNDISLGSPSKQFRNVYANDVYANFIGTLTGSMVGTTTGANRGQLQDSLGNTIVDPDTGISYTINAGNVTQTNGTLVVDVANREFKGTADLVVDGVYASTTQTITGSKTFTGSNIHTGTNNFNGSLQGTDVKLSRGVIGKGAITALDGSRTIGSLLIDTVTIANSKITTPDMTGGRISANTVIDSADIGKNSPAIQVKSQKFVDAVGTSITRFSTDGQFLLNSDTNVPTERAVKTYVDTVFGSTGQDIQFYLDTKDMTVNDVATQLTRLAPPSNFNEGTIARILGSYYYADYAGDGSFVNRYKQVVVPPGIGRIGGYTRNDVVEQMTDLINAKSSLTGYEFQLSATGNVTTDTQTYPTNANLGTFTSLLQGGTLTGWITFNTVLNEDQADEFSTDAVKGAKLVVVRNGLVETFATDSGLLQLVKGNVTYERAGASTFNGTVSLGGFATPITVYQFSRISRTSSAAWVFKGNI